MPRFSLRPRADVLEFNGSSGEYFALAIVAIESDSVVISLDGLPACWTIRQEIVAQLTNHADAIEASDGLPGSETLGP